MCVRALEVLHLLFCDCHSISYTIRQHVTGSDESFPMRSYLQIHVGDNLCDMAGTCRALGRVSLSAFSMADSELLGATRELLGD